MSYSKSNKMHCKVCESANKPMNVVTSHFPKNRDGFTVCPTLLSQECRYCNKKGHTTKYCSKKTKDEERMQDNTWVLQQERKFANEKANEKANKKAAKLLLASFDALYESSDEEEEVVIVKEEIRTTKYMDAVMKAPPVRMEVKEYKPKEMKIRVKIDWATAESDSEGDDSETEM